MATCHSAAAIKVHSPDAIATVGAAAAAAKTIPIPAQPLNRPGGMSAVELMWAPSYGVRAAVFKHHGIHSLVTNKNGRVYWKQTPSVAVRSGLSPSRLLYTVSSVMVTWRHAIQQLLSKSQMALPPLVQRQQMRNLSINKPSNIRKGLSVVALMWAPSHGVGEAAFKLHGIYLGIQKMNSSVGQILDTTLLDANLVKDLEEHWPNLECYGRLHKYVLFWSYQLAKHVVPAGMGVKDFLTKAMILKKSLPPTLGLAPQTVTTVDEVLKDLKCALNVGCGLSSRISRGYIRIHGKKFYGIRVLDEAKLATDTSFVLQDMWKPIWCGANSFDDIILPGDALDLFKSHVYATQFVYARGQPDHSRHLYQEYVKKNNREFIHAKNELVPFKIIENEQSCKKLGILVVPAHSCGAQHKQAAINHVHGAVSAWGIQNITFIVVVKDMAPINVPWKFSLVENMIKKDVFQSLPIPKNLPNFLQTFVTFIPISHDTNVERKVEKIICVWYRGDCLYRVLDLFEFANKDRNHPLRLSVLDKCDHYGVSVVVGRVESGTLLPHDTLITPSQTLVSVVQIFEGQATRPSAGLGDLVQVSLSGDDTCIYPGCVLSLVGNPVPYVSEFTAILRIEDLVNEEKLYKGLLDLHIHYDIVKCEIVEIIEHFHPITQVSLGKKYPQCMKKGALVSARIKVDGQNVFLVEYEKVSGLGFFVLKIQDTIVVSGKVKTVQ